MRIAFWTSLPPDHSEASDHARDLIPALAKHHEVVAVVEDPAGVDRSVIPGIPVVTPDSVPAMDLDVYQISNSPAQAFAYRAAIDRPGVVVLHEWMLHDLVWLEAVERNDIPGYLVEMRRSHGRVGSFVGMEVSRGRGGTMLPALLSVNARLLESSLGVVTLTREAGVQLERRRLHAPHLHLPQHVSLPDGPLPSRADARRALGYPDDALLVTAPGPARASNELEALVHAVGRLRGEFPLLRLVVAGELDHGVPLGSWADDADVGPSLVVTGPLSVEDLARHLVAADVVSVLRFPSRGEMPAVLLRALGVGRPALVSAGTPAATEMPEGVVVPVDPGRWKLAELTALLRLLLGNEGLRDAIGGLARDHTLAHHRLETAATRLVQFLVEVEGRRDELLEKIEAERLQEGPIAEDLVDEVRFAARGLGLVTSSLGLETRLVRLAARGRPVKGER